MHTLVVQTPWESLVRQNLLTFNSAWQLHPNLSFHPKCVELNNTHIPLPDKWIPYTVGRKRNIYF